VTVFPVFSLEKKIPNIELHNNPIKHIITIITNTIQPPAINKAINAFVPKIIAFTDDTTTLNVLVTPFAVLLPIFFALNFIFLFFS